MYGNTTAFFFLEEYGLLHRFDSRKCFYVVINDSASMRSPEPDVDGVSDSPYMSNYLMTDGQLKKLAAVSPSIDDVTQVV